MSLYTTEVRYICETLANYDESQGYKRVNDIVEQAAPQIFDDDFPIFDETYRPILEAKILKHYYTREIGFETVGLWQLKLNNKMNEIMPYYNKLYNSELLEFNPLYTVNLKKNYDKNGLEQRMMNEDEKELKNEHKVGENTENTTKNGLENRINSTDSAKNKGTTGSVDLTEIFDNTENENGIKNTAQNDSGFTQSTKNEDGTALSENHEVNSNDDWNKFSDTPQGGLTNVANGTYLTTATNTTSDAHNNSSQDSAAQTVTDEKTSDESSKTGEEINNNTKLNTGSKEQKTENSETGNESESKNEVGSVSSNADTASKANMDEQTDTEKNRTRNRTNDKNNFENYLESVLGWNGKSPSKLLQEFRETFLNIDMMIIEELSDLFFGLWA